MTVSDEELVQYLDGQLPPERVRAIDAALQTDADLANRMAGMQIDTQALRDAFEPLLAQAPAFSSQRVDERTDDQQPVDVPAAETHAGDATGGGSVRWLPLAASVLLALAVGFGAARYVERTGQPVHWHQAVVDYQQLYTTDTLPMDDPGESIVRSQLAAVSKTSGLQISPDMVQLPGLTFKRAQTLGHDGKPLVQLAFADRNGAPVALCFMPIEASTKPQSARIDGMNTVSWANGRYSFILVAHSDPALLEQAAAAASQQF